MQRRLLIGLLASCAFMRAATRARADGNTSLLQPTANVRGLFTQAAPEPLASGQLNAIALLDVGTRLLVIRDPHSGEPVPGGELVSRRLALHVAAAVGVTSRFELGLAWTLAMQAGDEVAGREPIAGTGAGDLRLRAQLRLFRRGGLAVSAASEVSLPTASERAYLGEDGPTLTPTLIAGGAWGRVSLAATLGYRVRGANRVGDLVIDDELVGSAGLSVDVVATRVALLAEAFGAYGTQGLGNRLERPVEALAGVRARVADAWVMRAGLGAGLSLGYGTPELRGVVAWTYAPLPDARRAPVTVAWAPPSDDDVTPPPAQRPPPPPPPPVPDVIEVLDDRIVLPSSVLFALGSAELVEDSQGVLARVLELWSQHPAWEAMAVEGHADVRGSASFNQVLSERRAHAVRDALIALGVDPARLSTIGLGSSRPLTAGTTEADHARNRRVELVITRRRGAAP
ncbi:MAG: OmpA family protein [Kofleriaceae bacterium]|nr:OmpA family protein [Kofleriaceae bacterium]